MTLPVFQATIQNESGDIIPSATVTVLSESTGLGLTIYSDRAGTTELGTDGVFTAGTDGFAQFYAPAGEYRILAEQASSGFERTWDFVPLVGEAAFKDIGAGSDDLPTNDDLPDFGGTDSSNVPTNANLSSSVTGTATYSSDTYTFSPSGTGLRALEAGMYVSFKLPSGSENITTTPDISYDGTDYTIKWIDGSALAVDDLNEAYNKQPIMFYFDGTDMLIASDISGSNSNGDWIKHTCGKAGGVVPLSSVSPPTGALGDIFQGAQSTETLPITMTSTDYSVCGSPIGSTSIISVTNPLTTTTFNIRLTAGISIATSPDVNVAFSGRWY